MGRKRLQKARYLAEYAGLRTGLFLFDHLPLAASEAFGCFLADCFYSLNASRRRIAAANIRRSQIASDPVEVSRIARASFRHFVLVAIESLKFAQYFNSENWRERAVVDISPAALDAIACPGEGLIVVSAHLGNWETAGKLLSFLKPVTAIARRMNNPYTNRIMERRTAGTRVTLAPKRDADVRRFVKALRGGNALALLVDQHAAGHGIMADFFGIPASTYPTPALLHLRMRVPLVFGYCLRTGPMKYRLVAGEPISIDATGDRGEDVQNITRELNQRLEQAIRRDPEQYLWAHRRWKH